MRARIVIIGGGPSGLLLSQLLHLSGVETVVLERRPRAYVMARVRAGVLEWGTVETLREAGVGERMDREGFVHEGVYLSAQNRGFRVPLKERAGRPVLVYGQTEVTRDLYDARDAADGAVIDEAAGVEIHGVDGRTPHVTYRKDGRECRIDCDYVIGCDGFHGVSRGVIPKTVLREYERVYPFGWLGVLSESHPVSDELIYANSTRGFALCSMRNEGLSRYYVQTEVDEDPAAWSDSRFWDELKRRIPEAAADVLTTGRITEKSLAPLRSYVAEPMRWGRLFLVGDAAHIVPPTGAKGLNLAVSDVHYLHRALVALYRDGSEEGIDRYSDLALARVWKSVRFSWWMTTMLHRFPDQTPFDQRIQESEIDYLEHSGAAQTVMAENYVGLPF
ncbi:4-hydroxybenzoate 3-monooxygenase [Pikeienuella piscinae]|uniref:4-hydroxybenzoate 3-monooxygenase n=1 Tax=Pikeienuella piscinae TaxID=2748098 RepID=A0A7L5C416_9RHOB|nr:4-hydroxybenzoate 3-monooxygenase [Pikeienuella piscinae]QIE57034.1 4-hydroxybenzoate 3-monooxygenase [Pikeienuella piscinae]